MVMLLYLMRIINIIMMAAVDKTATTNIEFTTTEKGILSAWLISQTMPLLLILYMDGDR